MSYAGRPTRSRISSPFVAANASHDASEKKTEPAERPKTFLDRWIEPPLPPPQPSFMDAGIERHGVVAQMAALGTHPSVKALKSTRAGGENFDGGRRSSSLRRSGVSVPSTPKEAVATQESTTSTSRRRSVSTKEDEVDWRPKTPVQQMGDLKSSPRLGVGGSVSHAAQTSPSPIKVQSAKVNGEGEINLEKTDKVIEDAVQEAVDRRRWPTAYALRTLYDDYRSNTQIVRLIEAIYEQRADEEQLKEFRTLMKLKKREGKKDRQAEYYFNGDGSDPPPRPAITLFLSPLKKSGTAGGVAGNDARHTINVSSASVSPRKEQDHGHARKRRKSNSLSRHETNGHSTSGTKGKANGNRKNRGRSNSVSSTSSLSSIDERILGADYSTPMEAHHARPNPAVPQVGAGTTRSRTQPITLHRALGTQNTHHGSDSAPAPSSSSISHHRSVRSSPNLMAPALLEPALSDAEYLPAQTKGSRRKKEQKDLKDQPKSDVISVQEDISNDRTTRMKRKAREITNEATILESFERHRLVAPREESASDGADSAPPSKRTRVRLLNSQSSKKPNYDSDFSSPTTLSFQPDLAPGSAPTSRAGTPSALGRPTRKARTGTGLRVKTSPMKKKAGTLAGIPRASGERNSPIGNGTSHNPDDNDEYCSACGGSGDLVCCDGCIRSFHFKCVDPPMNENNLPDEWFCNLCMSSRRPRSSHDEFGSFGYLLANLDRKNPVAFHLPKPIREYFVDVRTGPEGEYEEGGSHKPKNRNGYEETPDLFRVKDSKGNPILCHRCNHSASHPDKAIILCGFCTLAWHLDCLDPPLSKEPPTGKLWRCPCHVDDLLAVVPGSLGPAHRFRQIKGSSAIRPAIARGVRNNGHIEIENDISDNEDQGFYEHREYGHVYKLPELGIKLDFISQVRLKTGGGYAPVRIKQPFKPSQPEVVFNHRSIEEQQAALNLAELACQSKELADINAQNLIDALIAEAPQPILSMVAQGDPSTFRQKKFTKKDRAALVALQALIQNHLTDIDGEVVDVPSEPDGPLDPTSPQAVAESVTPSDTVTAKEESKEVVMQES